MCENKKESTDKGRNVTESDKLSVERTGNSGFQHSGQSLPCQGDLISFPGHGFGFVDSVIQEGINIYVNCYATVFDYTNEGGYMAIKQPDAISISTLADLNQPSESIMKEFRDHLNAFNLDFDYGYKKVINKVISRVEVGSTYYYIDTDMTERTAVDDGANFGIHYARFSQGNYFKNIKRVSLLGKETKNVLKSFIMPFGSY